MTSLLYFAPAFPFTLLLILYYRRRTRHQRFLAKAERELRHVADELDRIAEKIRKDFSRPGE
jgi:hypothetical protein